MEIRRINFNGYRSGIMLQYVIQHFDLRSANGTTLRRRGPCPLCTLNKPHSRHLAVNIHEGVWFCHGCKKAGTALTLYALIAKVNVYQAAKDLSKISNTPVPFLDEGLPGDFTGEASIENPEPGLANGNNNVYGIDKEFKNGLQLSLFDLK